MHNNLILELRKSVAIIFLIVFLTPYLFSTTSVRTINLPKIKPSENKVNAVKFVKKTVRERKTILFWNSYWDDHYFDMGAGNIGK